MGTIRLFQLETGVFVSTPLLGLMPLFGETSVVYVCQLVASVNWVSALATSRPRGALSHEMRDCPDKCKILILGIQARRTNSFRIQSTLSLYSLTCQSVETPSLPKCHPKQKQGLPRSSHKLKLKHQRRMEVEREKRVEMERKAKSSLRTRYVSCSRIQVIEWR